MTLAEVLARFGEKSALIVGDLCLDLWCTYDPALSEPSRETGIPRLAVTHYQATPGAAGTIANNLVALGVRRVALLSVIGDDGHGYELTCALAARRIQAGLLLQSPVVQTFTYTKLLNQRTGREDQPRLDFVNTQALPSHLEAELEKRLLESAAEFDVIFVSDQSELNQGGVVTPGLRERISALARSEPAKVIWVDSRKRPELFRQVYLKPNQQEADEACQRCFGKVDYRALYERTEARALVITQGAAGVLALSPDGPFQVPAPKVQAVDICGAGDSFSAGAAMALACGAPLEQALEVGTLVAGVTIQKPGTGTASPEEVLALAQQMKDHHGDSGH